MDRLIEVAGIALAYVLAGATILMACAFVVLALREKDKEAMAQEARLAGK